MFQNHLALVILADWMRQAEGANYPKELLLFAQVNFYIHCFSLKLLEKTDLIKAK